MITNMNGRYIDVGKTVVFVDSRFNYKMDRFGKTLSKEPGTAGVAFTAVWQKDKDQCETFFDSCGIERTILSRSNIIAGYFALDAVLKEIKFGDWKASGIHSISLMTRSPYFYETVSQGRLYKWQKQNWMYKKENAVTERLNKDLWIDMINILHDYADSRIKVETMLLKKEDYPVLNILIENPISLAQQASNGNNLMKDSGFEKIYGVPDRKDYATPL